MIFDRSALLLVAASASLVLSSHAAFGAGNVARGQQLYTNTNGAPISCANALCHTANVSANVNGITRAADQPSLILNAIATNKGGVMGILTGFVNATDAEDLAAYIANPNGVSTGSLALSSSAFTFGNQVVSTTSAAQTATVTNNGSMNVTISTIAMGGGAPGDFARAGTCAANGTLTPGGTCTITATFTPLAVGTRSASISVIHSGNNSPNVINLTGMGVATPSPNPTFSSTNVTFGNQAVTTTSAAQTVTLTNTGPLAMSISGIAIGGANPGDFARAGTCNAGTSLATNGSCTIQATFAPTTTGARAGQISIASNAPGSPHVVNLSGTGTPAPTPVASLSATMLNFGNYVAGTMSQPKTVTLTNTGSMTLNITSINRTGADFSHTTNCAATLAPNASCTIDATFAPTGAGVLNGNIAITSNAPGSPHNIGLSGVGFAAGTVLPTVTLVPSTLAFAQPQTVNVATAPQTVTLTNTGTVALTITNLTVTGANASEFARTGTCAANGTVNPNATCTIIMTFTPAALGARSATVNVISNAQGTVALPVSGTGMAPPTAAVTLIPPNGVTFVDTQVGATSAMQTVVISNTGNAPLTLQSVTATAEFTASHACGASIAAGMNCQVGVRFTPAAAGARTGSLSIASNAMGSPHTVALSGNGISASASPSGGGSSTGASSSSGGGGGCTLGLSDEYDPLLALLVIAALLAIHRRRGRGKRDDLV
jgi:hypothetical protein